MIDKNFTPGLGRISDRHCQFIMAALYFSLVAFWSFGIAFNGAPDESTHFFLLEYINAFHSLPDVTAPIHAFKGLISARTWQPGEFWYHGLPFPHVIGALLTTNIFGWLVPDSLLYIAARSINWLFGSIFVCALFRSSRKIGLGKLTSALIVATISLIPQVTFVFSYFNSDGYGLMCVALTISALLGYLAHPIRRKAIYLGAALGALFLAKVYFLPAIVFVAILLLAKYYLKKIHWKNHSITIVITALIFALPMLSITYMHYGEISGFAGQTAFVQIHKTNPAAGYGTCFVTCAEHLINLEAIAPWTSLTLKSYFSVTGWMNVFLPDGYYKLAFLLFISLIVFSIYQAIANRNLIEKNQYAIDYIIPLLLSLGLLPSIFILSLLASQKSLPQPQGRYLFVTIPFLCILLSTATQQMLLRSRNGLNDKTAYTGLKTYNLFLLVVAAWMTWTNLFAWKENVSTASAQKPPIAVMLNHLTDNTHGDQDRFIPIKKDLILSRLAINESQANLSVPFIDEMANGNIDELNRTSGGFSVRGWSYPSKNQGRGQYVIVLDGAKIKAITELSVARPDVAKALDAPDASRSGYLINVPFVFDQKSCKFKLYTLTDDFKLFSMPDVCEKLNKL